MYVWMVASVWGFINLAFKLIEWHGRISYERVRAASAAAMMQALAGGGAVHDERADGSVLHIEIPVPARSERSQPLTGLAGDSRAERQ
jgi:hypothetical protein